jgi:O-antigen ligase
MAAPVAGPQMRSMHRPVVPPAATSWSSVPDRLHAVFVGLVIAFYTGARIRFGAPGEATIGASDPLNTVMSLVLLVGGSGLILAHLRRSLVMFRPALPFVAMLTVMLVSALWSQAPENSLRRTVTMAALVLFAISSQVTLGPERFMRIAVRTLLAVSVLSLLEAVLRPAYGFDVGEYANAIRGLYGQKNAFGMALLTGALALSFVVLARGRFQVSDGVIILFLLILLVLSRSTTSLLLTLAVTGATMTVVALGTGGVLRISTTLVLVIGGVAAALVLGTVQMDDLLEFIGKDASLTGRTEIWEAVHEIIALRPLTGYGYAAFWVQGSNGVLRVWDHVAWEVTSAHSGYLEVMLQFGALGLILVGLLVLVTLLLAIRAACRGGQRVAIWVMLYLGVMGVLNKSESVLLGPDLMMVYWIMAVLTLAGVKRRGEVGSLRERGRFL